MAVETVCQFFKYGHCKFLEKCRNKHVQDVCENKNCEVTTCLKRHPRPCKFFQFYHRCKFNPCSYMHEDTMDMSKVKEVKSELEMQAAEIDTLKSKLEVLETNFTEIRIVLKGLNSQPSSSVSPPDKASHFNLVSTGIDQDPRSHLGVNRRIKELEENNFVLLHAVDDLERAVKKLQASSMNQKPCFICNYCRRAFQTEPQFRDHVMREHKT